MTPPLGRVLVVDDDALVRRTCERVLRHEGWSVTSAQNGREAIEALDQAGDAVDCVLSDIHMPEIDGFRLVASLRATDEDLPVLLMTGDPSLDGAVRALDTGAVSYIAKPFDHEALAAAVARAARRHGVARMRRRAESVARHFETADLEARFRAALAKSWMAYQPIFDIVTGRAYAYEALLRTDEKTLQRPDLLIGAAERLDRIPELGRAVRRHVAAALPRVPDDVAMFVNVHGLELADEDLYADDGILSGTAHRVVLEITERVGLDDVAAPARVAMLRKRGFRIAIDDLGAGYAALGALATLAPDIVKLDMSLIRGIDQSATKRRVVGALATLCDELGSRVVAEGVETVAEHDTVVSCGIGLVQGFLLARPERTF